MNILLILHSYTATGELGSFAQELVQGFRDTGANITVIKTNDLVDNLGARGFSKNLDPKKLKAVFQSTSFDMIFTTNHGGINGTIRRLSKNTPIVTWLVDRNPFKHNGYVNQTIFQSNDQVITSSTANVPSLVEKFGLKKKNVHYFPFMTNPASFQDGKEKDINVSFVGSYFMNEGVIFNAIEQAQGTKHYKPLLKVIEALQDDFDVNENKLIRDHKLTLYLLSLRITRRHFKGAVGNMVSNRKRLDYLSAVADSGLELFGTRNLAELVSFSPNVAACFNSNYVINTRERLVDIYDRSKIGLNINHHQATTGLGYRVFDVMCSSALLVSNFQKQSDLDVLFGKDHPIPIYKTANELREICNYYIEHDDERQKIATECRRLIGEVHTFKTRATELVQLVDPKFRSKAIEGAYRALGPDDLWTAQALENLDAATGSGGTSRRFVKNYMPKVVRTLRKIRQKND